MGGQSRYRGSNDEFDAPRVWPRVPRELICWGIRVVTHQVRFPAERQLEPEGNLGPEFAEHVETHVLKDVVAHPLCGGSEAALVVWVICVIQSDGACRP